MPICKKCKIEETDNPDGICDDCKFSYNTIIDADESDDLELLIEETVYTEPENIRSLIKTKKFSTFEKEAITSSNMDVDG